jgi:uncharacterized protein YdcH (DUF465 family)
MLFHPDIRKLPARAAVYAEKPVGYFDPYAASAQHPVVYNPNNALPRLALNNALFDRLFTDHLSQLQNLWQRLREQEGKKDSAKTAQLVKIRQLLTAEPIEAAKAKDPLLQTLFAQRANDDQVREEAKTIEQAWAKVIDQHYAAAESALRELKQ